MLRPLQGPPYTLWQVSVESAALGEAFTLGGLQADAEGRVLDGFGEVLPGLYAAGRCASGITRAPWAVRGLSLGECTFSGRRAGRAAAAE